MRLRAGCGPLGLGVLILVLIPLLGLQPSPASGQALHNDATSGWASVARGRDDEEVERMSDEEMAQRAAQSPDQISLGTFPPVEPPRDPALFWGFLGPRPITNEFFSGSRPASGRVSAIAVDPRDASVVYIAAAHGGVWKSVDGGTTWVPLTDHLSSLASGALAFDPLNPDILYYGTGEQHYSRSVFYGDGLFRTTDAGATWSKIALKADVGSYIARIVVKPDDPGTIFVASDTGLVRTTDGAVTWQRIPLPPGHCNDLAIHPSQPATVYAAIREVGVFKSLDGGTTWAQLGGGLPPTGASFARINFGQSRSNPSVLYVSFVSTDPANFGSLFGMYRTSNGGLTWTQLTKTPNYLRNQGWYDNSVAVDPSNPDICYAGGVFPYETGDYGMIRTSNGGSKWFDITRGRTGNLHPDQHYITFGPDGTLWVAHDGGVSKSADGGSTWINCNLDLELTQFYQIALHPVDVEFMLGGNQDNGSLRYTGSPEWRQVNSGDGGPSAVEWASPSIHYTTAQRLQPIYKWNNTALAAQIIGPWTSERRSFASGPLIVDPNEPNTLLLGASNVWKSTDSGISWNAISDDVDGLVGPVDFLLGLAVGGGNSSVIYSTSSDGRIYLTTDGGATWNPRHAGLPARPIFDIVLNPWNWQRAYVCVDFPEGGRVFRTTDAGLTWINLTGDLPAGLRALSLAVDFEMLPARLHLGTDYGVQTSSNDGGHWTKDSYQLPNCAVFDLQLDVHSIRLVAGTHGRGIWTSPLVRFWTDQHGPPVTASRVTDRTARDGFALHAIGPAAGRGPIAVRFELPTRAHVSLRLYDVTGRLVAVLADGDHAPGRHRISWDAKDSSGQPVRPGVYFARFATHELSLGRRLIVLP